MDLTLCLIIKNEEANLADCLRSFQGLYRKIVIADTGSTDRSKIFAADFGAKVYDFKWVEDFAAARNFALEKVESEWVMVVDADDRIEPEIKQKLLCKLDEAGAKIGGFFLPYNYSGNRGSNRITAYLPRIWRTCFNYRYTLPVHEYLDIPRAEIGSFIKLPFEIIHAKDPGQIAPSRLRNLRILEAAQKKDKKNHRLLFYLGSENFQAGNYAEAVKWLNRFIRTDGAKNPDELNRVLLMKGRSCEQLGSERLARNSYVNAIAASPELIEPYLHLGDLELKRGNQLKAVFAYVAALKCRLPATHVFVNASLYHGAAQKKIQEALMQINKK